MTDIIDRFSAFQEVNPHRLVQRIVKLGENNFPDGWLMFDELVQACNLNLSLARSGARSGDNEDRTPGISRGRMKRINAIFCYRCIRVGVKLIYRQMWN